VTVGLGLNERVSERVDRKEDWTSKEGKALKRVMRDEKKGRRAMNDHSFIHLEEWSVSRP
jgi:hypothetical protein